MLSVLLIRIPSEKDIKSMNEASNASLKVTAEEIAIKLTAVDADVSRIYVYFVT